MPTIEVDDVTAKALTARASARNMTLGDYLRSLMVPPDPLPPASAPTPEQRIAVWREWVDSHPPVHHFVDDSRESIYEGRGE